MAEDNLFEGMSSDESRKPTPGDIVSARYRWSEAGNDVPGEKIRPCLILKVSSDASSIIMVPISTQENMQAGDGIEISPEDRANAGVHSKKRSWVKLTEINRVDLPNMAIIPYQDRGRMAWRRGRVSDSVLKQVQIEISERVNDKTLKGVRVAADVQSQIKISGIRKISPELSSETTRNDTANKDNAASLTLAQRDEAIRAKAVELSHRHAGKANTAAARNAR
jgi:uncharacterized protein YifN (PemK superfamily)